MKKLLSVILIVLTLSLCACAKTASEYDLPVGDEAFESMSVISSQGSYKKYESESEIFDDCDLVVIGMPVNTFTDEQVVYFDKDGNEVDKESDWLIANTVRRIKVVEVLKGDKTVSEVELVQLAHIDTPDGSDKQYIRNLSANEFIAKQNSKYIYYLKRDGGSKTERYYACPDQGVVNIDMLDSNAVNYVKSDRLLEVINHFDAKFDKYDRSDENK